MCGGQAPRERAGVRCLLFVFAGLSLWIGATAPAALADHGAGKLVLPVDYVKLQFDKGRKFTTVDLRLFEDYRKGHLPGARSVPLGELARRFEEIPTVDLVVLYCDCSPSDAEAAYRFLQGQGYRNLSMMGGGFAAWVKRGYPIER